MYTIAYISQAINARTFGNANHHVSTLLTDSRSLCFPESTLFFALKTQRGDGHQYVGPLYEKGVRCFVVSQMPEGDFPDACFLVVEDTLKALQELSHIHRKSFNVPVVGIAGSNGKTTVKEWLYQMLSPDYTITRTPRSYNSQIGVPLSVWHLWEGAELGIFETAISQPGEMDSLEHIVQPTIGVFTCLGEAHQEYFESLEQKCLEKLKLFTRSKVLVYLSGNPVVEDCIRKMNFSGHLIPCTAVGDALQDNISLCRAVCNFLGMPEETVARRATALQPIAMRLEVLEGERGCTLINDTYNSDLNSLDIALDFMNRRPESEVQKKIVVMSDIEQTGMPSEMLCRQIAQLLSGRGIHKFVGVGHELLANKALFNDLKMDVQMFSSTQEMISSNCLTNERNSLILIKGARSFCFDEITDLLVHKVHETILEVNLQSIVDNLNFYRSHLAPGVRMICMVKADAYGAGAIEVAKVLQEHNVDYMAVAVADEGVALRKAGITSNIMVMNPEMHSLSTLFKYQLEPEVYSFRLLDALIQAASREGVTDFPIHLKVDTGMHRLGFDPNADIVPLIKRLKSQTHLHPRSVFSHFVGSDSDAFDDFSARQFNLFSTAADAIQQAFPHKVLCHICNSAGIVHFPARQMDMVRLGLGLYGVNPQNNQLINNVSTLKTIVLQIHDVPAGESVGYSRKTILTRDSRIATLPIGYADGLSRMLGNRNCYCLVNGRKADFVGNICMDVCMIDVTGIECAEGDSVVIFGSDLPVSVLSDAAHTIPYEILTGVSSRVKRVYYKDR